MRLFSCILVASGVTAQDDKGFILLVSNSKLLLYYTRKPKLNLKNRFLSPIKECKDENLAQVCRHDCSNIHEACVELCGTEECLDTCNNDQNICIDQCPCGSECSQGMLKINCSKFLKIFNFLRRIL